MDLCCVAGWREIIAFKWLGGVDSIAILQNSERTSRNSL
jgi:hypothetical protein